MKEQAVELTRAAASSEARAAKHGAIADAFMAQQAGESTEPAAAEAEQRLQLSVDLANAREGEAVAVLERNNALAALDEANAKVTGMEGGLTGYWGRLLEEGADLEQISEELRLQQESVDEYEELLGEARLRAARLPCYCHMP